MIDTKTLALAEKDYIVSERRYFHSHPELGNHEVNTTKHIMAELQKMGVDEILSWDDITGCVGIIHGKYPGKTVALRADIDALPIQEADLTKPYASRNAGVMHACGHDCHTAMLLGAAKILTQHREEIHGNVKLLFQMAEEIGTESRHYVEKGALADVSAIFGMHIWATLESGTVNIDDGPRMASSDRFVIKIHGRSVHGSAPDQGKDAIVAAAAVVMGLQTLSSRVKGSTATMLHYAQDHPEVKEFIVATEAGILHEMQRTCPNQTFLPVPPEVTEGGRGCACTECEYMKKNTLKKVYNALKYGWPAVEVDPAIARDAVKPIERMLSLS